MPLLNQLVANTLPLFPRRLVGFLSRHYIAGETFADATVVARQLMSEGCMITLDVLGEHLESMGAATEYADIYQSLPGLIASEGLDANLSVKPSQMGLLHDREGAMENFRRIARAAEPRGYFIRIDMEDSSLTDREFELYRQLRSEYSHTGIVIQSYLRRTVADAKLLATEQANVRLCKGIYREAPEVAFQKRQEIRESFMEILEL
ncbi:MAG: proline dehydrogenase family protein, partial [Candidatus Delongbacteria bacterium]|nr:proline dehydrogenase family protein [Candidatus Delongbacteria bacterium]